MQQSHRIAATILALMTSACSVTPTMAPTARLAGGTDTAIRAAAATETAGLLREIGATGSTLDRRMVSAEDLAEFDRNRDGQIDAQELSAAFAENLSQTLAAAPTAAPVAQTGPGLPQFFVNPNLQANQTKLLIDEEQIFPELFAMIQGAQRSIQMDFFLLGGEIGLSIARALAQKQNEGVEVNLMMDPKLGLAGPTAAGIHRVVEYLKLKQVDYRFYPLALFGNMPNGLQNRFQIDHNKLLVVDGTQALIGSMNLDDGARMNHDLMVKVEGPTAAEIGQMLKAEWVHGTDPNRPTMRTQANSLMRLTQTAPQERTTRELLLREIARAQRSIHVAMYEFGDPELAQALAAAYKRGIDVKLLLDDKGTLAKYGASALPSGMPNVMPARTLFDAGAQVRWYQGQRVNQELHMKMALFDGTRMVAGSTNWTTNALNRWRETSFVLEGATALEAQAMFNRDWQSHSRRIDRISLKQRMVARTVDWMNKHDRAFW